MRILLTIKLIDIFSWITSVCIIIFIKNFSIANQIHFPLIYFNVGFHPTYALQLDDNLKKYIDELAGKNIDYGFIGNQASTSSQPMAQHSDDDLKRYISTLLVSSQEAKKINVFNNLQSWINQFTDGNITGAATPVNDSVQTEQKWIMPVYGYKITSGYGNRFHPVYKALKFHDGIDIGTPLNTPVKACADGKVSVSGWIKGYGNYIQIEHAENLSSFYAHLNHRDVKKGQIVKRGQIIGKSGNTGIGTGSHLHFGAKRSGKTANPLDFIEN